MDKEPEWQLVYEYGPELSLTELNRVILMIISQMRCSLYVKRFRNGTGRDPEFFLEPDDYGN